MEMSFGGVPFLLNAEGKKLSYKKINGREHAVMPSVLLTEGVHAGSAGPLFYSKDAITRNVQNWNNKPIVDGHPKKDGNYVSAANEWVIEKLQYGFLLNSNGKNAKLSSTAYVDVARADEIQPLLMEKIRAKDPIEVSTGLYYDLSPKQGVWNGESYIGEITNIVADHLAVLVDSVGACSVKDGGGLMVMSSMEGFANLSSAPLSSKLIEMFATSTKQVRELILNEMSQDERYSALLKAVRSSIERFGNSWDGWLADVFSKFVVFMKNGSLFKVDYKLTPTGVELVGDPVSVVRKYVYVTSDEGVTINSGLAKENGEMAVSKVTKANVDALIASGVFSEAQREALMASDPSIIESAMALNMAKEAAENKPAPVQKKKPSVSLEDWMKDAPEEVRGTFNQLIAANRQAKAELVDDILALETNEFTKEYLESLDFEFLKGMHRMTAGARKQNDFSANGGGNGITMFKPRQAANQSGSNVTVPEYSNHLPLPGASKKKSG